MLKDFLRFVRRPTSLLGTFRAVAVGSAITATGAAASASEVAPVSSAPSAPIPTIVDRSKKLPKVLLRLPGVVGLVAEHRSHRSHSSHSSHYSSSGGGSSSSPRAPATPTSPPSSPPATSLGLVDSGSATERTTRGTVTRITTSTRVIEVQESPSVTTAFAYRDDSKFVSRLGVSVRFDDFAEANSQRLPIAVRENLEIRWRPSPDGKTKIIVSVRERVP